MEKRENNGQAPVKESQESIRAWYDRTTARARKILVWSSAIAIVFGAFFFSFAPLKLAQFMQTANGAITIPIAGAIWIGGFIYIFLVPSREVGFRSQESVEEGVKILREAVEEKALPVLQVWQRIGTRVEMELNQGLMDQIKTAIKELREATAKITSSAETSNLEIKKFSQDATPAIDALKRLNERIDKSFSSDLMDDLKMALTSVKQLSLPPADPNIPVKEPNVNKALSMISKKPSPKQVIPPPPLAAAPAEPPPTPVAPLVPPAPVAIPSLRAEAPVVIPISSPNMPPAGPVPQAQPVASAPPIPQMVPTQIASNQVPVQTQPVAQAPVLTSTPSNRFAPAPPPSPVMGNAGVSASPMGGQQVQVVQAPSPLSQNQNPVPAPAVPQIVLPHSSSQRQAHEGPAHRPSTKSGEIEINFTQNHRSKPVVVTPIQPQAQMGGVQIPSAHVAMVTAPQVIQREA